MTPGNGQAPAAATATTVAERLRAACEEARHSAPAAGPGWAVASMTAQGDAIGRYVMDSYSQVESLVRSVAPLGFAPDFGCGADPCDLVFVEQGTQAHASVPKPDIPAHKRLEIRQGDLVMEDCGGPVMLVHTISADLVYCVWFSEEAHVRSGTFNVSRLVNVSGARRKLQAATPALAARTD